MCAALSFQRFCSTENRALATSAAQWPSRSSSPPCLPCPPRPPRACKFANLRLHLPAALLVVLAQAELSHLGAQLLIAHRRARVRALVLRAQCQHQLLLARGAALLLPDQLILLVAQQLGALLALRQRRLRQRRLQQRLGGHDHGPLHRHLVRSQDWLARRRHATLDQPRRRIAVAITLVLRFPALLCPLVVCPLLAVPAA